MHLCKPLVGSADVATAHAAPPHFMVNEWLVVVESVSTGMWHAFMQ